MTDKPLLIFDFDGVIIDGMNEYWSSSRQACLNILSKTNQFTHFPLEVPKNFQLIRPWIYHGWEMALIAAECVKPSSHLNKIGLRAFTKNYHQECKIALNQWGWNPKQLQKALDDARQNAIANDYQLWLSQHHVFPGLIDRIKTLRNENIEFVVLTTKSITFTKHLLQSFNILPSLVFGHESGAKQNVIKQLSTKRIIRGFIEDRRSTLEIIIQDPDINFIPCYLATWGYLKPEDLENLPNEIRLLKPTTFKTSIKNWP